MKRRLRESQKAELRRAMMETGLNLLQQQGFERTTIEEITSSVGVSKGTFYTYFNSKEDLVFAAIRQMQSGRQSELKEFLSHLPNARARVRAYFEGFCAWSEEHAELTWIWSMERFRRGKDGESRTGAVRAELIRVLHEGQELGEVSQERDPELISIDLQGIFFIHYVRWYHRETEQDLTDVVLPAIDQYLSGALTRT